MMLLLSFSKTNHKLIKLFVPIFRPRQFASSENCQQLSTHVALIKTFWRHIVVISVSIYNCKFSWSDRPAAKFCILCSTDYVLWTFASVLLLFIYRKKMFVLPVRPPAFTAITWGLPTASKLFRGSPHCEINSREYFLEILCL